MVAALATLGCQKVTFAVRAAARQETLDRAQSAGLEVDVVRLSHIADRIGDAGGRHHPAGKCPALEGADGQHVPRGFAAAGSPLAGRVEKYAANASGKLESTLVLV